MTTSELLSDPYPTDIDEWNKPESCAARIIAFAEIPHDQQKDHIRQWPELGWDAIVVARCYVAAMKALKGL